MKKMYLKPEVQYTSFETKDIITDDGLVDGEMGGAVMSGWDE